MGGKRNASNVTVAMLDLDRQICMNGALIFRESVRDQLDS